MKYLTLPNIMIFVGLTLAAAGGLWKAYQDRKEKESDRDAKIESDKRQQRTEKGIEDLLKTDKLDPERLRLTYPLGFVIFEIEHSQRVIPSQKQLPPGYDIDLGDNVSFSDFPPNQISVTMPKFRIKEKTDDSWMILPKVTLPKQIGAVNCVTLIPRGNVEEAFSQCAEILRISDFGLVFLVGVKRLPLPPGYKRSTPAQRTK
jgi:hypothetical protein